MPDNIDPYKVLGIERTASQDEIEAAYRERVLKYHPDRGGDAWAFQQVQQAYEKIRSAGKPAAEPQQPRAPTAAPQTPRAASTNRTRSASDTAGAKATDAARRASSAYSQKRAAAAKADQQRAAAWFVGTMIVLFAIVVAFVFKRSDNGSKETTLNDGELVVARSRGHAENVTSHGDAIEKPDISKVQESSVITNFPTDELRLTPGTTKSNIEDLRKEAREELRDFLDDSKESPSLPPPKKVSPGIFGGGNPRRGGVQPPMVESTSPSNMTRQTEAAALITRLSTAPDPGERMQIIRRLTQVAPVDRQAAIDAITSALDDVSSSVADMALQCLRTFGQDARSAVPSLVNRFKGEASAQDRIAILHVLSDVNGDSSQGLSLLIEVVRGASSGKTRLTSSRYSVPERLAAVDALGRLGPKAERAVPVLLDALKLSALDMEHFDTIFEKTAMALGRIGVSGRGVAATLRQFRDGKGIRPPNTNIVAHAKETADTVLKTLDEMQARSVD